MTVKIIYILLKQMLSSYNGQTINGKADNVAVERYLMNKYQLDVNVDRSAMSLYHDWQKKQRQIIK